ncbi:MAG: hypothetical protein IKA47_08530 [Oscillospiraceae bacterium]|nr:hypothetical protein [Oscillospiraceae bacterium]
MRRSKLIPIILLLALVFVLEACNRPGHECPPPIISNASFPLIESVQKFPGPGKGTLPLFEEIKTTEQNAKPSVTKTVFGEAVVGTYLYSIRNRPDIFYTRVYAAQTGRLFGSDEDGILRFYSWDIDESINTIRTQQECLDVARKFLTPYVNVDNYKVSSIVTEGSPLYTFTFTKYYGDYPTVDQATVTVHQSGQLYDYRSTMFGKLPDRTDYSIDETKLSAQISQKIASMYPDVEVRCSVPAFVYDTITDIYALVDISYESQGNATEEQLVFYIYLH